MRTAGSEGSRAVNLSAVIQIVGVAVTLSLLLFGGGHAMGVVVTKIEALTYRISDLEGRIRRLEESNEPPKKGVGDGTSSSADLRVPRG